MRSKEEIIQAETDRLKKLLNREKFIYEPNITEELLFDIRDHLKRIGDHWGDKPCPCGCEDPAMGDRPHLEGKPEITHPHTIEVDKHQGRITNCHPERNK